MKFPILLPNIFNHPFTYESDLKLGIGDFVEVPFGKSKMVGVVWNNFEQKTSKSFRIKKIIRKLEIPRLKEKTLHFLNWFAEYNIVPKGMALKLVLVSGKPIERLDNKFYQDFKHEIK
jgi:primosomal protein N' (replication factor Y)